MSTVEGSWDREIDEAWRAFGRRLGARLASLPEGEVVVLRVEGQPGEDARAEVGASVAFRAEGGDVHGEVSSNFVLPPGQWLTHDQEQLLLRIGWQAPPHLAGEHEPDSDNANFFEDVPAEAASWLAELGVRALRDVLGPIHPSLLDAVGLEAPESPPGQPTSPDREPEALVRPECSDDLRDAVDEVLEEYFGEPVKWDSDGDAPVQCDDSVLYVRVRRDRPAVELWSVLVSEVRDLRQALFEVNVLNRDSLSMQYYLVDNRILARQMLVAMPFVAQHLRDELKFATFRIDHIADDLIGRVGGRKWLTDEEPEIHEAPPRRRSAAVWMRTLDHLEAEAPGSVDADLAAHIFHMDERALLDQIGKQESLDRPEMVSLLREALRVVIEVGAGRRSSR